MSVPKAKFSEEINVVGFSNLMKVCATCSVWGGIRDPGGCVPSYFVLVDSWDHKGKCFGGRFANLPTGPAGGCDKYTKWPVLR